MILSAFKTAISVQNDIKDLCIERYKNPGDFNKFAETLKSLGVQRQTYDVVSNSLFFYSNQEMICSFPVEEIDQKIEKKTFHIGDRLETKRLKQAIQNFDNNQLSVLDFHQEVAASGVVYVSVFLNQDRIYYIGQDGNHFIELYNDIT